jgi:putative nucleotidyltransferase with HDIG domain
MSPAPESNLTETQARAGRVAALAEAIAPRVVGGVTPEAWELCSAFDEAVEFAACEGKSVAAGIREFLDEDWGPSLGALRKLVTPAAPFVPERLPVLPRAASRLLRTADETASVSDLKSIAESDPAFTAQLLRAANSVIYGSRHQITRLRDAVMRLGIPNARRILLAASFSTLFAGGALRRIWEHSQEVAARAQEFGRFCGVDPETAFAAGLLHDVGRLAFTVFPRPMQNAEQRWLEAGFPLIYAETMAYGKDHTVFGAELLSSWELPQDMVEAVRNHHRPECPGSTLHAVIHLAEDAKEDLWSNMRKEAALERTGISRDQLEQVLHVC